MNNQTTYNSMNSLFGKAIALAAVAFALSAVSMPTYADSHAKYEKAYQALANGEIQPLQETLNNVLKEYPGKPIKIELDRDDGMYEYEIKILRDDGSVVKIETDAASGKIKEIKERRK